MISIPIWLVALALVAIILLTIWAAYLHKEVVKLKQIVRRLEGENGEAQEESGRGDSEGRS